MHNHHARSDNSRRRHNAHHQQTGMPHGGTTRTPPSANNPTPRPPRDLEATRTPTEISALHESMRRRGRRTTAHAVRPRSLSCHNGHYGNRRSQRRHGRSTQQAHPPILPKCFVNRASENIVGLHAEMPRPHKRVTPVHRPPPRQPDARTRRHCAMLSTQQWLSQTVRPNTEKATPSAQTRTRERAGVFL